LAGSNNFVVFNEDFANAESDATYLANTSRLNGLTTGIASTVMHNKLFRQLSTMTAAIGEFIKSQGSAASDVDLTALTDALTDALTILVQDNALIPGTTDKSTQESKTLLMDVDTRKVEITRVGGVISTIVSKDPSDNAAIETVTINRASGVISTLVDVVGSTTATYTINRTGGQVSSITKAVV
jgi:hypothetical protein